ncbi:toxic anion resistance protein [Novosphingobium album (ex Liu et al. 2023)]|uniref:Toxic anion resistance protein n=1 Tax=Novosphingobium album (ex Liu et al. 2023) TaxID=3031130 RepID=A0ABT5WQL1_9SPHN|nr:toxic anion resistance protein [Novosphingobium album (ex Liu et al. 2023)]MDE8652327.1 toxic anion resistance protein [Novosphingobium album (ex Liu et al. 2023)]
MTVPPKRTRDADAVSLQLLRQWLAGSEDDTVSAIDRLGREAIRDAARAGDRLGRDAATSSSDNVLRDLQALADAYAPAPRRRFPFSLGARANRPTPSDLDTLATSLEHERDNLARQLIGISTDTSRLQAAEGGLEDALALIRACGAAVEAAAREISVDRPDRARFLRETAAPRLLAREQDVLTQMAVTRQGVMALQWVAEGQRALALALERARETTMAALRTALATRRAIEDNRDLLRQADALERSVEAARSAPASRQDVERALADAVEQVRRAIAAAQASTRAR